MQTIYTVGHSNHTPDTFLALLKRHEITAIADVRSVPYSRFVPQFNKDNFSARLQRTGIIYVFLGFQLGAQPNNHDCYNNGKVDFRRLSQKTDFRDGLTRIRKDAAQFNLALLCTEKDPILCHRMVLICRHLRDSNTVIKHILEDGELEDNRDSESRLLKLLHMPQVNLFETSSQIIEEAYDQQSDKIAHHDTEASQGVEIAYV